jgi:hypothetical protein
MRARPLWDQTPFPPPFCSPCRLGHSPTLPCCLPPRRRRRRRRRRGCARGWRRGCPRGGCQEGGAQGGGGGGGHGHVPVRLSATPHHCARAGGAAWRQRTLVRALSLAGLHARAPRAPCLSLNDTTTGSFLSAHARRRPCGSRPGLRARCARRSKAAPCTQPRLRGSGCTQRCTRLLCQQRARSLASRPPRGVRSGTHPPVQCICTAIHSVPRHATPRRATACTATPPPPVLAPRRHPLPCSLSAARPRPTHAPTRTHVPRPSPAPPTLLLSRLRTAA